MDNAGNVYVADTSNDLIRKISPSGVVTTLAGSAGQAGSSDGIGTAARLSGPLDVAVDSAGNLYVADTSNDEIRKISNASLVSGDTPSFTETYNTKNAGTGLTVTVTGSVNDGNGGHNYAVTFVTSNMDVINKAGLTITAAANTKTYDSTTSAVATPMVVGLVGSDTVTGLSETYNSKNAGTGKTLLVAAGYTVSDGNSGGNYTVTTASSTSGMINKAPLTITAAANTKTYDSTTSAAVTPTVAGLVGNDTVTGLSETYNTKNACTGKTLSVAAGYTVSDGNSGGNYTVTTASSTSGMINKAPLTITAAANTKTYDSTTSAAVTPTVAGLVGNDTVTGLSETYNTKNACTGKTLTVAAGYTLSDGNGGGNYTVATASSTAGAINKTPLTITAVAYDKIYDGNTSAAATPTVVGLQGGSDTVTGLSETYDNKNVGTGKTLTVAAGYVVNDGNGGLNYAVTTTSSTAGVIDKAPLTITAAANTKTYDSTASAAAMPTVAGLVGSDTVTGLSETYDTKNAGTGKTLTVAAGYMVSDGNGGGNYRVTTATSREGVINKAPLTVTAAGVSKIYDGATTATVVPSDNRVSGDNLTDSYTSASFSNAGPALNIPVTVAGIAVNGPDAGNYALQNTTASTTANVYQSVAVIDDCAGAAGGWTTTGTWTGYPNQGCDGDIHQAVLAATTPSTATWSFGDLDPSEYYKVETTWTTNGPAATSNRAANAPYTISGGAAMLPVYVNQKLRRPE